MNWNLKSLLAAGLLAVGLLAVSLFVFLAAWQLVDEWRTDSTMRMLCREIQDYRQRTGQLPPNLDSIADGKAAGWLSDLTNSISITYDPGAPDRMPRLAVSARLSSRAVQGPGLENAH
jgi:hypothetical protein